MHKTQRAALIAAVTALIVPSTASGATKIYGGETDAGGKVAMTVQLSKTGAAKRITELRGVDLRATCEISGEGIPINGILPVDIKVSADGKFAFETADAYGNRTELTGRFLGRHDRKATGRFVYASHFPATETYPEEDCTTGENSFEVRKGAPDVSPPPTRAPYALR